MCYERFRRALPRDDLLCFVGSLVGMAVGLTVGVGLGAFVGLRCEKGRTEYSENCNQDGS